MQAQQLIFETLRRRGWVLVLTGAVLTSFVASARSAARETPWFVHSLVGLEVGPTGAQFGRFCYNSGYLVEMKQIVAGQLAYGIDGFHIDMMDQRFGPPYGCWCDARRAQFEREFGQPMSKGATWDESWEKMLEFRCRSSERIEKALHAHIKSINPRATVDYNYHGNPPFSFEVGQRPVQQAGNGDFVTGETGVWVFSALTVGLNAEFYRAAVPRQRVRVAMQHGMRMYHDQTARFAPAALRIGLPDWPFLVTGPATVYKPTTANSIGELLKAHRTTRQRECREGDEWPMSADAPVGPAILVNQVGKGKVQTFAGSPDLATASEHHIVEARKLLASAVRYLNAAPRIRITAPTTVEAIVTDDPAARTRHVHLLGYNAPPQTTPAMNQPYVPPGRIEDAPRYRATFHLDHDPGGARAWNKSIKLKRRGRVINLDVEVFTRWWC